MPKIVNTYSGPEAIIQSAIIKKLILLGWSVKSTHGNMYQFGFPDLYCCHRMYGVRWVEVKDPRRRGDIFTNAQHEYFAELQSKGVGVWILTGDSDEEIKKLHGPDNWHHYLRM